MTSAVKVALNPNTTNTTKYSCKWWRVNKYGNFSNLRALTSDCSGLIEPIIEFIRDLMINYILTKCGADWFIFVDATVKTRSFSNFFQFKANNSSCSGPIEPIMELIQDIMVTYIFTKFGFDWLISVDTRV